MVLPPLFQSMITIIHWLLVMLAFLSNTPSQISLPAVNQVELRIGGCLQSDENWSPVLGNSPSAIE
jgi:hypothetical protein